MSKKNRGLQGVVYSTNPDFGYTSFESELSETLEPSLQDLRVQLDKKQRAGKAVTLLKAYRPWC